MVFVVLGFGVSFAEESLRMNLDPAITSSCHSRLGAYVKNQMFGC